MRRYALPHSSGWGDASANAGGTLSRTGRVLTRRTSVAPAACLFQDKLFVFWRRVTLPAAMPRTSCGLEWKWESWGDRGYGYISAEVLEQIWWEGWKFGRLSRRRRSSSVPRSARISRAHGGLMKFPLRKPSCFACQSPLGSDPPYTCRYAKESITSKCVNQFRGGGWPAVQSNPGGMILADSEDMMVIERWSKEPSVGAGLSHEIAATSRPPDTHPAIKAMDP